MINEKIETLLAKKTIVNYKKATKLILDNSLTQYASYLLEYAEELLKIKKSWQMICQLFDALGLMNYKEATNLVKQICEADIDEDMITTCATKAYIRLTRQTLRDVSIAIEVLQHTKSHAVREGVLWSLGQDKVVPGLKEQELLIEMCKNWGTDGNDGRSDLRQGLAAACAGWDAPNVRDFLEDCKNSTYAPLQYAAEKALKRQYPTNW